MLLHLHEKVAILFAALLFLTLAAPVAAHAFLPGPPIPIQFPLFPSPVQPPSGWLLGDPAQNPFFWPFLFPQGLSPDPASPAVGASQSGAIFIEIPSGSSPAAAMPPGWPFIEPGQVTPVPPLVIPEPTLEFPLLFPQTQGGGATIFIDLSQATPPTTPPDWPFTTPGTIPTGGLPTVIPGQGGTTVVLPGGESFTLPNEFVDPALLQSLGSK